jgi:hypothetical protein
MWKLTTVPDVLLGILLGVVGIEALYMIDMRRRGARIKPDSVLVIFLIVLVGEVGAYIHTGPIAQVSFTIVFGLAALLTHLNREHWLGKD